MYLRERTARNRSVAPLNAQMRRLFGKTVGIPEGNMSNKKDVFVIGAARGAIGSFGGTLKNVALSDLATLVVKAQQFSF